MAARGRHEDRGRGTASPPTGRPRSRGRRPTWGWKRIVGVVISIAIVVGIFAYGVPRFASYGQIADVLTALTWLEIGALVLATVFNLVTYWWANQAALPGLGIGKAATVTQATTAVANTLPAGGAVAIGLTYAMLDSWGFSGTNVALFVGVTGIWNIFTKLGLPLLALAHPRRDGARDARPTSTGGRDRRGRARGRGHPAGPRVPERALRAGDR